ncbi:hypothetical protein R6H00_08360, partial [Actinotignum timonense]|nr:hypothetical protein [Actinotignum timonense]
MTELPVLPAARSLRAVLGECLAACGVLPEMESAAAETEQAVLACLGFGSNPVSSATIGVCGGDFP